MGAAECSRRCANTASSPTIGCSSCPTSHTTSLQPTTNYNSNVPTTNITTTLPTTASVSARSPIQQHSFYPSKLPNAGCSAGHASSSNTACACTPRLRPTTSTSPTIGFPVFTTSTTTDAADGIEHPGTTSSIWSPTLSNRRLQSKHST